MVRVGFAGNVRIAGLGFLLVSVDVTPQGIGQLCSSSTRCCKQQRHREQRSHDPKEYDGGKERFTRHGGHMHKIPARDANAVGWLNRSRADSSA